MEVEEVWEPPWANEEDEEVEHGWEGADAIGEEGERAAEDEAESSPLGSSLVDALETDGDGGPQGMPAAASTVGSLLSSRPPRSLGTRQVSIAVVSHRRQVSVAAVPEVLSARGAAAESLPSVVVPGATRGAGIAAATNGKLVSRLLLDQVRAEEAEFPELVEQAEEAEEAEEAGGGAPEELVESAEAEQTGGDTIPEEPADKEEACRWMHRHHPGFVGIAALLRANSGLEEEWEEEDADMEDDVSEEEEEAARGSNEEAEEADANVVDAAAQEQAAEDDRICWDFVAGRCKRGDRCWYLHKTDKAAKAAAARSLVRAGRPWRGGGLSEAAAKLASLFATSGLGLEAGDKKLSAATEQEQEWHLRCNITPLGEAQDVVVLDISMGGMVLGDDGMLSWAYWMDKRLNDLRGEDEKAKSVNLHVPEIDFSGNKLGNPAIRTLCALCEKHAVHCDVMRLDDNLLEDSGLRDIARYLTSFEQAPVRELNLSRNKCSARGVGWLFAMLAMHPAYPVWQEDDKNFWPLRLHLGEELLDAGGGEELAVMVRDLTEACSISICAGNDEDPPVGNAGDGRRHNCVAQICGWDPPAGLNLPRPSSYAMPIFGKACQDCSVVDGAARTLPVVLQEYGEVAVVYKPSGWICGSDTLDLKLATLPQRERAKRIEALTRQEESPALQAWILLHFGADKSAPIARDLSRTNGLCHRLDVGTSGPVLVAKTERGYDYAKTQIHERDLVKDYLALVHGCVRTTTGATKGACRGGIDRSTYETMRRVFVSENGDPAVSIWEVIAEYESPERPSESYTLVHLRIITGRTHQIRAHMAHMGHPLVGDWSYQSDEAKLWRDGELCKRIFLHKFRISFKEMQGFAASVSCSLQMDSLLWNALKRLRLVGGLALQGCAAPGIRGVASRGTALDARCAPRFAPSMAATGAAAGRAATQPLASQTGRVVFARMKRPAPETSQAAVVSARAPGGSQPPVAVVQTVPPRRQESETVLPPNKRPRVVSPVVQPGAPRPAAPRSAPPGQQTQRAGAPQGPAAVTASQQLAAGLAARAASFGRARTAMNSQASGPQGVAGTAKVPWAPTAMAAKAPARTASAKSLAPRPIDTGSKPLVAKAGARPAIGASARRPGVSLVQQLLQKVPTAPQR